jgi:hypothetical protein
MFIRCGQLSRNRCRNSEETVRYARVSARFLEKYNEFSRYVKESEEFLILSLWPLLADLIPSMNDWIFHKLLKKTDFLIYLKIENVVPCE